MYSMHWIQIHILEQLLITEQLRNRDLRPEQVESNLFQYHLNQLVKHGYVRKTERHYTLAAKGLAWADRYSGKLRDIRPQTKIITAIGLYNDKHEYLLIPKPRQPYVSKLYVPSGKTRLGELVADAARREANEKIGLDLSELKARGHLRVCVRDCGTIVTDYIAYLFQSPVPQCFVAPAGSKWIEAAHVEDDKAAPATRELLLGLWRGAAGQEIFIDSQ